MKADLDEMDLNLLKLLKVVVETRNTSVAAKQLGISQTSVSRGMAKLRDTFGDQLFIRKAHGVEPSELAEELAKTAENMLTPFKNVLDSYQDFDPKAFEGKIVIALELSLLEIFGQGLYEALSNELPKASIGLVYWQLDSLQQTLDRQIDYIIHFSLMPFPQDIHSHSLSNLAISLVARKDHPVLSKTSDWEAIHHLPLALLVSGAMVEIKQNPYLAQYHHRGYTPNLSLLSHSLPVVTKKLETSDHIQIGSSYQLTLSDKLACYPMPLIPKELRTISISGNYLQTKRGYPLTQHLHQTIQSFFDSVTQPSQV